MGSLSVFPVLKSMVPDYNALEGGLVRYVGRKLDVTAGGFVMSPEAVTLADRAEYIAELKAGGLLPADAATAAAAGIKFDAK